MTKLSDPFGEYRAEYLRGELFDLYSEPRYFPELETNRPCVLFGGRGTGKTTVLKCLSYEGRLALLGNDYESFQKFPYYGCYYRVNTNRVTAFSGGELEQDQWRRLFAHYINLLLCGQMIEFVAWYGKHVSHTDILGPEDCADLADALFVSESRSTDELSSSIARGRRKFEAFLNNVSPEQLPSLSMQGQPIDDLCASLRNTPEFQNKSLFFIVDEFENLLDYQQEVFNTLIKHCGSDYTFKVGIRQLGWRRRSTLNPEEQLISPADYQRIDIEDRLSGEHFSKFALEVCRLRAQDHNEYSAETSFDSMFAALSAEDEAKLLGVDSFVTRILKEIERKCPEWRKIADAIAPLELYLIDYWARSQKVEIAEVFEERERKPQSWEARYGNYKYPILFTLKRGKPGVRKHYCGWRTYTSMASGNIRYLLELVGLALTLHKQEGGVPSKPIKPELQTKAAIAVGRKNVAELEGLSVHGAQLTKLLLGLGRVFEVFASDPEGHTPEVTQFHLPEDEALGDCEPILSAAVMHNTLVRSVANKRMDLDLKAYDYSIHPIFSAFFSFSHRRKRKFKLQPDQIVKLVHEPRAAIKDILSQSNRTEPDYSLPEQMQLFEGFYIDQ